MASRNCERETVVDLYAGIGYFTLPYLVHARAAHLHACEWDSDALRALRHNLRANGVYSRCTVYPGDNARSACHFEGIAHRVNLGLIPSRCGASCSHSPRPNTPQSRAQPVSPNSNVDPISSLLTLKGNITLSQPAHPSTPSTPPPRPTNPLSQRGWLASRCSVTTP